MEIIQRIDALRHVMKTEHLDAFIFFDSDGHHSLPVADHWKAVEWLSGFKCGDGMAVITMSNAALWVHANEFTAAEKQLEDTPYLLMKQGDVDTPSVSDWLGKELEHVNGAIVGIDGKVTSYAFASRLTEDLRQRGGINLRINFDPLSVIWTDRPGVPMGKVEMSLPISGLVSAKSKAVSVRSALRQMHADGMLVSDARDIAWILNLHDTGAQSLIFSAAYLLVSPDKVTLYVYRERLVPAVVSYLKNEEVEVDDYTHIQEGLRNYFAYNILMDGEETNALLPKFMNPRTKVMFARSPISALKR